MSEKILNVDQFLLLATTYFLLQGVNKQSCSELNSKWLKSIERAGIDISLTREGVWNLLNRDVAIFEMVGKTGFFNGNGQQVETAVQMIKEEMEKRESKLEAA